MCNDPQSLFEQLHNGFGEETRGFERKIGYGNNRHGCFDHWKRYCWASGGAGGFKKQKAGPSGIKSAIGQSQ